MKFEINVTSEIECATCDADDKFDWDFTADGEDEDTFALYLETLEKQAHQQLRNFDWKQGDADDEWLCPDCQAAKTTK